MFTSEMTIVQALRAHPRASDVFAAHHLCACPHCSRNKHFTIAQICAGHGFSLDAFLADLNALLPA